jgi:cation/acetate symporter
MGIFSKKMNKEGAVAGMVIGVLLMLFYMTKFKFGWFGGGTEKDWWFGISPEGFGSFAMMVNFLIAVVVSKFTPAPDQNIQELIENIRNPNDE